MLGQFFVLITYMLIFAVALMLVAFGGMFTERSGVINIGLEGTMVVGGMAGILVLYGFSKAGVNGAWPVIISIIVAIAAGMIYSLLLAVVCINFKADQTLVGTAMNLLSTSLALIIAKRTSGGVSTSIQYHNEAFIHTFTIGGAQLKINIFFYIGIAVLLLTLFILYKTKYGLRLMACGENPSAADSVGINVIKYRYTGVLISGALAGIGAMAYIVPTQSFFNSDQGVGGFGFLALAVMIFGQWKPGKILGVSFIFSFFSSLSWIYFSFFKAFFGVELTEANGFTKEVFKMIPYIASLFLLIFTSKKSRAPKAEGIPYDKGAR